MYSLCEIVSTILAAAVGGTIGVLAYYLINDPLPSLSNRSSMDETLRIDEGIVPRER
jgi:hypothetical protein